MLAGCTCAAFRLSQEQLLTVVVDNHINTCAMWLWGLTMFTRHPRISEGGQSGSLQPLQVPQAQTMP